LRLWNKTVDIAQGTGDSGGPLETTLSKINRLIANVTPGEEAEDIAVGKVSKQRGAMSKALVLEGKEAKESFNEDRTFDLKHLGIQELSEEDISELKEFAIAGGYHPHSVLFGSMDEEVLGCFPGRAGAKVINTLTKSIGFPKMESELSNYRKQHIVGCLYSDFKVGVYFFCSV
jgi:hypothetical protein